MTPAVLSGSNECLISGADLEGTSQHPEKCISVEKKRWRTSIFSLILGFFYGEISFVRKTMSTFFINKGLHSPSQFSFPTSRYKLDTFRFFKILYFYYTLISSLHDPPVRKSKSQSSRGWQPLDYVLPVGGLSVTMAACGPKHEWLLLGLFSPHLLPPCCKCLLEVGLTLQLSLVQLLNQWLGS